MDVSINGARILATIENVPLFGKVQITQTLAVAWLVMIIISALCIWLGSGLTVTNISRKQAVAEMAYGALVNFVRGNMGPNFDRYIPLVGTIFITSVISNLMGLVGIWSPTADLMTELAWGLVVFVLITYHKIKSSGIKEYLRSFLDPIAVLLPINIMSECFTPVSMACRHFGNILSGTVISTLIMPLWLLRTTHCSGCWVLPCMWVSLLPPWVLRCSSWAASPARSCPLFLVLSPRFWVCWVSSPIWALPSPG